MIVVRDLRVRFGRTTIIDGLDLDVAAGESLALWGGNGAGKTTAIRAMLGLIPFRGRVSLNGHDARKAGKRARAAVGYVPQRLALYDDMGSLSLLRYVAALRRAPADEPAMLLERVGLGAHAKKAVGALSGGMRQRLALAAALLGDPPLLILDEPTASLDTSAREDFVALLAELRVVGKTLLLTTHRLEEVVALADRAVVLENGQFLHGCAAAELGQFVRPIVTVRLVVAPASIETALEVLQRGGFEAHRNGRGLLVSVAPGERAGPVEALVKAAVPLIDLSTEDGR